MNSFSIILLCFAILSCFTLVSAQGYRCTPRSTSTICNPIEPQPVLAATVATPVSPREQEVSAPPALTVFNGRPQCSALYRTLDGKCTNLANPLAGSAGTAQFTYIPGSSSVVPNGRNRPSPRLISNRVSEQGDVDMPNRRGITLFFVFFGQFLDHDLVLTPVNTSEPSPIPVPRGDPIFANLTSKHTHNGHESRYGHIGDGSPSSAVLQFSRSVRVGTSPFNQQSKRPVNANSSPIDLSVVYGSEQERFEFLHLSGKCEMRTSLGKYLPLNFPRLENEPTDATRFFLAGDVRPNENPALTSIHTVFIREHNKLCGELSKAFPKESPTKLFELARKINIFQMQKIVYEEFLPAITGRKLRVGRFNPDVDPSVSDIFSTAAFRLGHTMVSNTLPTGQRSRPFLTARDMFFRDALTFRRISRPGLYLSAAARTIAQEVDVKVVDALRNFLFSSIDELTGIDLIALNLQRGRDHALPSYNTVRKIFKLPKLTKFSDVTSDVALQARLRSTYRAVDDMDLWVALLAEDHVRGASMGETMLRVWEAEFQRLAEGDRFFYTTPGLFDKDFKRKFTRFQKISKSKTLMRDILLRNTRRSLKLPKSVFRKTNRK